MIRDYFKWVIEVRDELYSQYIYTEHSDVLKMEAKLYNTLLGLYNDGIPVLAVCDIISNLKETGVLDDV